MQMEIIYFGMMEEARQILLLDFGDVPGDRPARLDYIQLTIGLLVESMITHILKIGGRCKVREQIHEEASNSRENPETIISNSTLGLGDNVRATRNLPNMKRTV